jgi:N-(2-amino-2-carboxyethyl)-L-glutamate synthase
MPVINRPQDFHADDLFVDLRELCGYRLFLKCEGFNFGGSIKLKVANEMVLAAEESGLITPDSVLVESSSGNLGVALSIIAANQGYQFVCVTDVRCNPATRRLMEAYGGEVHVVEAGDHPGGLLGARIDYVKALCAADDRFVWLNQYSNPANWRAHYGRTAPEIISSFPDLGVLFVGTGTTGTLMGCARYFREHGHRVTVVAVDTVGSVIFGGPALPRLIPGLGSSIPQEMLDLTQVDDVVHVPELDAIRTCHRLGRRGFLFGGSTGTVVDGALRWLTEHDAASSGLTAVAIAPDLGERYLDSVYRHGWVEENFGAAVAGDPDVL